MIRGILFDKDGTLLEFGSTMYAIYREFIKQSAQKWDLPAPLVKELQTILGFSNDGLLDSSLLRHSTNQQIATAVVAVCHQHLLSTEKKAISIPEVLALIDQVSLAPDVPYTALPGIPETLTYLRSKGYPLGVVTADSWQATEAGLQQTGILSFFSLLGTGDMANPKPDAYFAKKFARKNGIGTAEILVVGDSLSDMHFADNAGAQFVGIATNVEDENSFRQAGKNTVRSLREIIPTMRL